MSLLEKIPVRVDGYRLEEMEGETLLYDHQATKTIYLNETAALIWSLCDGTHTVGELVDALKLAYPEEADNVEADVSDTIERLRLDKALDWK